jgi:voltage-gated potassium channel
MRSSYWKKVRRRVHYVLDSGGSDRTSKLVHRGLILLVIASVTAAVMESEPGLALKYGRLFFAFELVAASAFTIEYLLRLWSAPEHTPYRGMTDSSARWAFARTPLAIADLLCVLPVYLAFFVPADLRVLLMLRLLRFFKLARYSPGMRSLMAALEAERTALAATSIVLLGLVLISATIMHLVEHEAQPDKFGSIPDSMWWAIVTLTTVGYGDVVPITPLSPCSRA